ncbi:hypothetical protein ACJRO7_010392 [Eucalyptus globulus]|uniref:glutamine synthetase n=1 Tax=Eucalyptus globulus TaxID=34317 RepID=A0ABD3LFG4_EUCGL
MTANTWISLLLRQKKNGNTKSFCKFKVYALKSMNNTISDRIGGSGIDLHVNFDGSSIGQALGEDSELIPTNKHVEIFSNPKVINEYGIEQENTLLQTNVQWPLGWPVGGYPRSQACLYAGINISGTNGEVMPGQNTKRGQAWEIEAGHHIWCSRYLLERFIEQLGVVLTLAPKPIEGDWNGVGCHTNYRTQCVPRLFCNTKSMGEEGGFEVIKKAILNLSLRCKAHIGTSYGERNWRRLTSQHETTNIDAFSWIVANHGCSFRVGRNTKWQGKGYLEDTGHVSNMKTYVVTSFHVETTIL